MGRIACHWREAFERRGLDFVHICPSVTAPCLHKSLWAFNAWEATKPRLSEAALVLAHEPVSGIFTHRFAATAAFSHGIEARGALLRVEEPPSGNRLKQFLTKPLWTLRRRIGIRGLRTARLALLSSNEDAAYLRDILGRQGPIFVFRNGCDPVSRRDDPSDQQCGRRVLFFGSWLRRKGCDVLVEAAQKLDEMGIHLHWTLAGTGKDEVEVLRDWPERLREKVRVVPLVSRDEEGSLYAKNGLFVLPSRFEGQPLTLLQAMAYGCCCVTSRCCGQKDVVNDRVNGLLVTPGSVTELVGALRELWTNASLRNELAAKAADSMRDRSWRQVSDELAEQVLAVCA